MQPVAAALVLGATREGLLLLLLIAALVHVVAQRNAGEPGDRRTLFQYAALTVVLALLATIPLPELGAAAVADGGL